MYLLQEVLRIMTQCWLHSCDAFGWRKKQCFFTNEDGILIKVLRQSKGYSARKLLEESPDKDWSCSALDWLLRQIDATGSADRQSGSSRERIRSSQETCKCLCKWQPLWAQTVITDCIVYELLRRLFHIGNFRFFSSIFTARPHCSQCRALY